MCIFEHLSTSLNILNLFCNCRWHGKGLLRLAEGGEVAGVWKNGKREGKVIIDINIKTALAQIPISTFSHLWVFVRQYGIMFVIIVIIIIIIIIIYRKVKVSTLKHV